MNGKHLVLATVVFSFFLAAWSLGIYANRVPWANEKKGGDAVAEIDRRDAEVKRLQEAREKAEPTWEASAKALKRAEDQYASNKAFYNEQLFVLQNGRTASGVARPVLMPAYDKAGKIQFDAATGRPALVQVPGASGAALKSLAELGAAQAQLQQLIIGQVDQRNQLVAEEKKLTNALIDEKSGKGLRYTLSKEQEALQKSEEEKEHLRPILYNLLAETELLVKRNRELQARVKELSAGTVSSARP